MKKCSNYCVLAGFFLIFNRVKKSLFLSLKFNGMKMNTISLIACFSLVLFVSGSCDKDEPQPPTKTELITSASWKYESGTYNGSAIPASMTTCLVDNTLTFSSSTYTVTEGSVICSPSTATPATPPTWSFQNGETQLVLATSLVPGTSSGTFTIVTLNSTNLVISQNVALPPSPTPFPLVITFKH